ASAPHPQPDGEKRVPDSYKRLQGPERRVGRRPGAQGTHNVWTEVVGVGVEEVVGKVVGVGVEEVVGVEEAVDVVVGDHSAEPRLHRGPMQREFSPSGISVGRSWLGFNPSSPTSSSPAAAPTALEQDHRGAPLWSVEGGVETGVCRPVPGGGISVWRWVLAGSPKPPHPALTSENAITLPRQPRINC
ncbi:hypothetical protein NHX12_005916, partial [Muraenolepis orangiensis]